MKNSCAGVHAQTAMAAFIDGLERGTLLRHKLKRLQDKNQLDLNQMIQLASEFAAADDDARGSLPAMAVPTQARRNSSTKRKTAPEEKQSTDMVAMTFAGREGGQHGRGRGAGRRQQRGSETNSALLRVPQTYEEYCDMSCLVHLDVNGKATHTNQHCKFVNDLKEDPESGYKRSRKNRPRGKGKENKKEEEYKDSSDMDEDVDPKHAAKGDDKGKNPFMKKAPVYHSFLGTPTIRQQKTSMRILMATLPPVPQYLRWS